MKRTDYRLTLQFLNRYANKVVKEIKARAPVDTGSLRADVTYKITFYNQTFNILFYIDDHLMPVNASIPPSEYGSILDNVNYINKKTGDFTRGWFSDPIPGLDQNYFVNNLQNFMAQDIQNYVLNSLKN